MSKEDKYVVGQIVAFSTGEYSDYSIGSFAKVLKDITQDVWEQMREACREKSDWNPDYMDMYKAVPWMVANGYIEEIEYHELHLGDYGRIPEALP